MVLKRLLFVGKEFVISDSKVLFFCLQFAIEISYRYFLNFTLQVVIFLTKQL